MTKLLGSGKPFDMPAIIKDPFHQDRVTSITLDWRKYKGKWTGDVGFQNGDTTGRQNLIEGEDLDAMVAQIKAILETLKNK